MESPAVPFGDLRRQNAVMRAELDAAMARVIESGWYILGREVASFEEEFAAYCGAALCVGVASGAEALYLALAALDAVGPDAEVITVANACMYQVAAILQAGARPVLIDVDPMTHTMDPQALEAAISSRTRAIMPVHLFGRLADMPAIMAIADRHGIPVVEDAAQAHGAWLFGTDGHPRKAGVWGAIACFSFYPSKNLGALGDGGALTTSDPEIAARLRRLRMYGWGSKYHTREPGGRNSRLDELQAALLRVKLRYLDAGNAARRERASWYAELLAAAPLTLPSPDHGHVYHLYVIESSQRDLLRSHLQARGVGCDVHYPEPAHLQPAYADLGYAPGSLPHTETLAGRILSLPMFPELSRVEVERVAAVVIEGVSR
ncbi:DegT/DnrJ/EryC1/StrS family aminotransferase [Oscillochloris sp. ZM17-4]|uniref:DegT/DnrJ/EryC1/StrS family aminotransferase n=1 Tax=Oscillochloris sp. ZM17-4 TaxID=2866714 RepID=UPI001C73677F|nr:DegT/DnrJ/EryC1/StrS family aminotransferase [Oscillochloris sp. ZM17-4]MBX0328814.1 DegT/DnrJ/EryC1/StrS family aminotransferase [Oscillochloris sp. ZM17-4]